MWVDCKPVDVEVDDDNTGIFHVFELRIQMNEFDHRSFELRISNFQHFHWLAGHRLSYSFLTGISDVPFQNWSCYGIS